MGVIILALGILNMLLILFQLGSGFHWIKVPFGTHRKVGITLLVSAVIHATLAIIAA